MVPGARAKDIDAAGREIMVKHSLGLSMAALLDQIIFLVTYGDIGSKMWHFVH